MFVTSCDEREGVKPTIEMLIANNQLYSDGAACNLNYTDITFILEGSPGFISGAKIMVEYDASKGLFIGSGSSQFIIADELGVAEGRFVSNLGTSGVISFTASMERFPSVREVKPISIYKLPDMDLTADDMSIPPNGTTTVYARLTDQLGNVANKAVNFSTSLGMLESSTATTDSEGIAEVLFFGNNQTGSAVITASLQICSNVSENITIILE